MDVIFRDVPSSPNGDAAYGILDIPDGYEIDDFVGKLVSFRIIKSLSDIPFDDISNQGVFCKKGASNFYGFKIFESKETGENASEGKLLITGPYTPD